MKDSQDWLDNLELRSVLYDFLGDYKDKRYLSEGNTDQALAAIEALLSKRELEARLVELDLLEQAMNRATEQGSVVSLTPYKIMRLKDLEDRIDQLTNREEG